MYMGLPMLISLNLVLQIGLKVLCEFGESEIRDFGFAVVHKDICHLKVTMDDVLLG